MCRLLEFYAENGIYKQPIDLDYKMQRVVDLKGDIIGGELLIQRYGLNAKESQNVDEYGIKVSSHSKQLIHKFSKYVIGNIDIPKYVFINIERSFLCEVHFIADLIALRRFLACINKTLVVELTERNTCGNCQRISEGLSSLKFNKVTTAIDDYDLSINDFRRFEVKANKYDLIKVNYPSDNDSFNELLKLVELFPNRIIVEGVERKDQFNEIRNLNIFGIQGFLFCKGVPLQL